MGQAIGGIGLGVLLAFCIWAFLQPSPHEVCQKAGCPAGMQGVPVQSNFRFSCICAMPAPGYEGK